MLTRSICGHAFIMQISIASNIVALCKVGLIKKKYLCGGGGYVGNGLKMNK